MRNTNDKKMRNIATTIMMQQHYLISTTTTTTTTITTTTMNLLLNDSLTFAANPAIVYKKVIARSSLDSGSLSELVQASVEIKSLMCGQAQGKQCL
jgi:hypothetical protein